TGPTRPKAQPQPPLSPCPLYLEEVHRAPARGPIFFPHLAPFSPVVPDSSSTSSRSVADQRERPSRLRARCQRRRGPGEAGVMKRAILCALVGGLALTTSPARAGEVVLFEPTPVATAVPLPVGPVPVIEGPPCPVFAEVDYLLWWV